MQKGLGEPLGDYDKNYQYWYNLKRFPLKVISRIARKENKKHYEPWIPCCSIILFFLVCQHLLLITIDTKIQTSKQKKFGLRYVAYYLVKVAITEGRNFTILFTRNQYCLYFNGDLLDRRSRLPLLLIWSKFFHIYEIVRLKTLQTTF